MPVMALIYRKVSLNMKIYRSQEKSLSIGLGCRFFPGRYRLEAPNVRQHQVIILHCVTNLQKNSSLFLRYARNESTASNFDLYCTERTSIFALNLVEKNI